MYVEIFAVAALLIFVFIYRKNKGDNSYKFIAEHSCCYIYVV